MTLNRDRVECKVADPCGNCRTGIPHRPLFAAYDPALGKYTEADYGVWAQARLTCISHSWPWS